MKRIQALQGLRRVLAIQPAQRRVFHTSRQLLSATLPVDQNSPPAGDQELSGYPGASTKFTTKMNFVGETTPFECFRRTDEIGNIIEPDYESSISDELLLKMYTAMCTLATMDSVFYDAQRQGRISFYMTSIGEEAIHFGCAGAISPKDVIYAQYREAGLLLWRGFSLQSFANQLFSNTSDLGKGRQMPIHYGSKELNYHTISSPLGTQIPHAVGAAYAFKREGKDRISICFFGEGAASEGDFHSAFNMAATLSCPMIFVCRNNGFAISTPSSEQYKGDGIAARGPAYGVPTIRVDGNDLLAVYDATKAARKLALKESKPVLIEMMTYRVGHHSTSDDSTAYRAKEEIMYWMEEKSPINRVRLMLERKGVWDGEKEIAMRKDLRSQVLATMKVAEVQPRPPISQLFSDIYDDIPQHLQEQKQEMLNHLEKYASKYNLTNFDEESKYNDPGKQ